MPSSFSLGLFQGNLRENNLGQGVGRNPVNMRMYDQSERHSCRASGFEVIGVDGSSSGVVHCEDTQTLTDWVQCINHNIQLLNIHHVSHTTIGGRNQIMLIRIITSNSPPKETFSKYYGILHNGVLYNIYGKFSREYILCLLSRALIFLCRSLKLLFM